MRLLIALGVLLLLIEIPFVLAFLAWRIIEGV